MKNILKRTILIVCLIAGPAFAQDYDLVVKSPTSFFRDMARVMLQTPITWNDPTDNQTQLTTNASKFLQLQDAIKKQNKLNIAFAKKIQRIVEEKSILNGHELHLLGKILGASHALSARSLEYSSLYNIEQEQMQGKIIKLDDLSLTKRNLIWLSTHVNLFGLYRDGYINYYSESKIRRIVKNILKADSNKNHKLRELGSMIAHTTSNENRANLRKHLISYKEDLPELKELAKEDKQLSAIIGLIEENPITPDLISSQRLKFKSHSFIDGFVSFLDKTMNIISAFFGNTVGSIRWRKGYLFHDKPTRIRLAAVLQPLDMIFEKTPFALTDTFIPGNFGHAAMYIGSEDQIKKLGMWHHPSVIPHHEALKKGHVIVEALRPGVRTASLEEWMNIDEILILRHPTILKDDKEEVYRMYTRIMEQIGKKYDFNFDVTTTDKVVCSELVYHAFGKINWPTKYIMGRATISPDDVAQVALYKNSPIAFNTYVYSNSKSNIVDLNIDDMAQKMGFVKNLKRSTEEVPSYDRVIRKCRKVRRRNLRQGSHRNKHRLITVCKTEYKELDYKSLERSYSIDKRHAEDGNH